MKSTFSFRFSLSLELKRFLIFYYSLKLLCYKKRIDILHIIQLFFYIFKFSCEIYLKLITDCISMNISIGLGFIIFHYKNAIFQLNFEIKIFKCFGYMK